MGIKALGYRLTVLPDKVVDSEAEKTKELAAKAGIVLHDRTKEDLDNEVTRAQASVDQGIVLSMGTTAFSGEPWCQVGDYIAYARHAGKWVKDPDTDENVLVINDEDVICLITTKDAAKDD